MKNHTSSIHLQVQLDENRVPEKLYWKAEDQHEEKQECKAFLLSLFDSEEKDTFRIDLWTKEMQVQEMDRFFYHTLKSMAQTYRQATSNKELSAAMGDFVNYFGQKIGFLAPEDTNLGA